MLKTQKKEQNKRLTRNKNKLPLKKIIMTNESITYNEYSILCNKALGWLCVNQKEYETRDKYGYMGRESDWGTIERVAIERYINNEFAPDGLLTEAFECVVYDNDDYDFMPNYVTSPTTGTKYNINTLMDMCNRVSSWEVEHGHSPNIVYLENPNPSPTPTPEPISGGVHEQILNMNAQPCDSGFSQCTNYYCACNSVQAMIYYHTGIMVSEYKLAKVGGTTTNGTGHDGINTMIQWFNRNYAPNLTIEWKNFSELGFDGIAQLFEQDRTSLFFHLLYRNKWGHYEVPRIVNLDNNTIQVYNSLSGGYLETRSFNTQKSYINGISQKGVCIIRRTD